VLDLNLRALPKELEIGEIVKLVKLFDMPIPGEILIGSGSEQEYVKPAVRALEEHGLKGNLKMINMINLGIVKPTRHPVTTNWRLYSFC